MNVALVNKSTNIVENIIVVDSLEDKVSDNYFLVEIIPEKEIIMDEKQILLAGILENVDYTEFEKFTYPNIVIGKTKWDNEKGFY